MITSATPHGEHPSCFPDSTGRLAAWTAYEKRFLIVTYVTRTKTSGNKYNSKLRPVFSLSTWALDSE
ncbi:hypothetical protein Hanom_Chr15g01409641 [Helianthus anomalus]